MVDRNAAFVGSIPPGFYTIPFGFHDPPAITGLLAAAGFESVEWSYVEKSGASPTAAEAAVGLIEGSPIYGAILERRPDALSEIKTAVAANVAAELGDHPVRTPLRALVFSAHRPA